MMPSRPLMGLPSLVAPQRVQVIVVVRWSILMCGCWGVRKGMELTLG